VVIGNNQVPVLGLKIKTLEKALPLQRAKSSQAPLPGCRDPFENRMGFREFKF